MTEKPVQLKKMLLCVENFFGIMAEGFEPGCENCKTILVNKGSLYEIVDESDHGYNNVVLVKDTYPPMYTFIPKGRLSKKHFKEVWIELENKPKRYKVVDRGFTLCDLLCTDHGKRNLCKTWFLEYMLDYDDIEYSHIFKDINVVMDIIDYNAKNQRPEDDEELMFLVENGLVVEY